MAVIDGEPKRTTYGIDDGDVESDYKKDRSSGRSTRRDDRPVSEAGHTPTSDRLSGRSYARSHRGTVYGEREFDDNYDRRGSKTVRRSRAEEHSSGRGDRRSRYVRPASSSSDGHRRERVNRRRSGSGQRMYDHCDSRTVLPRRAEERDRGDLRPARRSRAEDRTARRRDRRSKHGRSSLSSSDGGSGNTVIRSRKDYIRLQKFSGTDSFETFCAHFRNSAAYSRWTEKDQLVRLKVCLTSGAGKVLWDSSPDATDTLQKLTDYQSQLDTMGAIAEGAGHPWRRSPRPKRAVRRPARY